MTSQDYRSRTPARQTRSRNIPAPINGANDRAHKEDGWQDAEVPRSISPISNASSRLRARRAKKEFVAVQPGTTRKRHRQTPQPARRKYYVELSRSDSEAEEMPLQALPSPPPSFTDISRRHLTEPIVMVQPQPEQPVVPQQFVELSREYGIAVFEYSIKVVAGAFRFCRRFFSYALGVFILWFLISMMTSQLIFFARPFCSIPIVSPMIPFCHWDVFKNPAPAHAAHISAGRPVHWADYPKLVDIQTKTFDQLLDENVGSKGLTLEVKKAEMAGNDLITLVRASNLKSGDQVAERLGKFVDDARGTGRSLHSLGAKIRGAVDSITSLNDYALKTIENAKPPPPSFVARMLPFALSTVNPTEEAVIETFLMSMDHIAKHMVRLREEAEVSMDHLLRLEEHLIVLHEITHRENKDLTAAQEDILAELWTWLGGNRDRLRRMDLDLDLLKNVENYRKKAKAHVVSTLQTLQTLDADMEELRTRVAAPEIVGDKIPIEVHVMSIKAGVERLKDGQIRASLSQRDIHDKVLEIDQ